jgi:predicted RNase H-like HicB family nuclease
MADGATVEEAIAELHDAIAAWKERAQAMGREIPEPHFEQRRFG